MAGARVRVARREPLVSEVAMGKKIMSGIVAKGVGSGVTGRNEVGIGHGRHRAGRR